MLLHTLFDLLAIVAGLLAGRLAAARLPGAPAPRDLGYVTALVLGAATGAFGLGTLNLIVSGHPGIARSVFGALLGAILAAELYKQAHAIRGSTGARFVLPLAIGIGTGRIGCHLAGLEDFTHGTPSALPWAVDFGDGVARHPVQLYETAAMLAFAAWFWRWMGRDPQAAIARGFYVFAGFAAVERFALEFLKPYGTVAGLTVFQFAALALLAYAIAMNREAARARSPV